MRRCSCLWHERTRLEAAADNAQVIPGLYFSAHLHGFTPPAQSADCLHLPQLLPSGRVTFGAGAYSSDAHHQSFIQACDAQRGALTPECLQAPHCPPVLSPRLLRGPPTCHVNTSNRSPGARGGRDHSAAGPGGARLAAQSGEAGSGIAGTPDPQPTPQRHLAHRSSLGACTLPLLAPCRRCSHCCA